MRTRIEWPALALAALLIATPAAADDIVTLGAPVYGPDDTMVGKVVEIDGENAVIDTGHRKVTLTLWSIFKRSIGLKVAMTQAQLEAAASEIDARAEAEVRKMLKPRTTVFGRDRKALGTLETFDGYIATLRIGELRVKFPLSAFSAGPDGLTVNLSSGEMQTRIAATKSDKAQP